MNLVRARGSMFMRINLLPETTIPIWLEREREGMRVCLWDNDEQYEYRERGDESMFMSINLFSETIIHISLGRVRERGDGSMFMSINLLPETIIQVRLESESRRERGGEYVRQWHIIWIECLCVCARVCERDRERKMILNTITERDMTPYYYKDGDINKGDIHITTRLLSPSWEERCRRLPPHDSTCREREERSAVFSARANTWTLHSHPQE